MTVDWNSKLGVPREELPQIGYTPVPVEETTQEVSLEALQVENLCKESLDFLAGFIMPTIFRYCFPDIYKAAWSWLLSYVHKSRDFSQLALGLLS